MTGRIAIIIYRIGLVGGAERLAFEQAQELRKRGIDAELIVLNKKTTAGTVVEVRSLFDVGGILKLARHLRGYNSVVTHMWYANTVGRIAALMARVPHIVTFEHDIPRKDVKTLRMLLIDKCLRRLSIVVAVSEAARAGLEKRGLHGVKVLENGIDFERIRSVSPADVSMYRRPLYLFAGRLIRQKGADIAIQAFNSFRKGTLLIAGEGEEEESLKALAGPGVVFLGPRSDIPSLMKAADYFIFPSRYDARPIIVLEAMAVGVPTITSEYPTLLEEFRTYARTVPVDDVAALARAMQEPPQKKEVNLDKFTIQKNIDELLTILKTSGSQTHPRSGT